MRVRISSDIPEPSFVVARTERFVAERLAGEASGHDWWHIARVRHSALTIGAEEGVDLFVVELAALLHDIADWKLNGGDELLGATLASEWLSSLGVEPSIREHVAEIIATTSFKGVGVPSSMRTREGAVVQDADRLDAMGAIGIARAFAFGGFVRQVLHDPDVPVQAYASAEAYNARTGTTINHFHEKLLLLRDRMNTATGQRIAADRHAVMDTFLTRFLLECDGKA